MLNRRDFNVFAWRTCTFLSLYFFFRRVTYTIHNNRYNNAELTFRPSVDKISTQIAIQKRDENEEAGKKIEERLLSCASSRMQNKIRLQQRYMAKMSQDCKFRPNISETSREIASKTGPRGTFLERQIARESQRKENYMKDLAKHQPSRQCT